jgi:ActR/RegA family two-component response regulator
VSPLADAGKLDITTLGGDAALLKAISAETTSSPPTVESVSFIKIQFVLSDFEANCSPAAARVNVAVPEP